PAPRRAANAHPPRPTAPAALPPFLFLVPPIPARAPRGPTPPPAAAGACEKAPPACPAPITIASYRMKSIETSLEESSGTPWRACALRCAVLRSLVKKRQFDERTATRRSPGCNRVPL